MKLIFTLLILCACTITYSQKTDKQYEAYYKQQARIEASVDAIYKNSMKRENYSVPVLLDNAVSVKEAISTVATTAGKTAPGSLEVRLAPGIHRTIVFNARGNSRMVTFISL